MSGKRKKNLSQWLHCNRYLMWKEWHLSFGFGKFFFFFFECCIRKFGSIQPWPLGEPLIPLHSMWLSFVSISPHEFSSCSDLKLLLMSSTTRYKISSQLMWHLLLYIITIRQYDWRKMRHYVWYANSTFSNYNRCKICQFNIFQLQ